MFRKLNPLLLKGIENNKNDNSYYGNEERKLLNRIAKYKNNYFAWITNYASVKSYIETCYRNGIDEYTALRRLCDGSPYTVAEILGKNE